MTELAERIAAVLDSHIATTSKNMIGQFRDDGSPIAGYAWYPRCACGWVGLAVLFLAYTEPAHRAHVAEQLAVLVSDNPWERQVAYPTGTQP